MIQVRITGWRHALKKVSMTETIREAIGLGLAEAKGCTDRVLDGEVVALDPPDWKTALSLVHALRELGADAELGVGVPAGQAWDVVHTIADWYDGPRAGVAEYGGAAYWYRSVYLDGDRWNEDEDRFELTPLTAGALERALEIMAIFDRWDAARRAGEIVWDDGDEEAFGALPEEMARYRELERLEEEYLAAHPPALTVRGWFESGSWNVRWTPLDPSA